MFTREDLTGDKMSMNRDVEKKLRVLGIGRFQVMALLQAARFYRLTGDLDLAKSFGLNRAVFYAWAKYHGPRHYRPASVDDVLNLRSTHAGSTKCPDGFKVILGECLSVGPRGFYELGGSEQLPNDFDDQVYKKLKLLVEPEKAWRAALDYVSRFPEWVLRDPAKFYKLVYEPVRDSFFRDLVEKGSVTPPKEIVERLDSTERMLQKVRSSQKTLMDYHK